MKIVRFYATESGESKFQDVELPINQPNPSNGKPFPYIDAYPSPSIQFVELPTGTDENWHHAPARQIVIVLSGTLEVVTSDNQKRQWRAGEFFIADDLKGKGHLTRAVGGSVFLVQVQFPQNFDLSRW
jgi:quercetin dioxygenase-like cupin family protein